MLLYPPFPLKYHDPAKINASTSQCSVNYYQGLKNKNTDDPNYIVCNKKKKKKMRHPTRAKSKIKMVEMPQVWNLKASTSFWYLVYKEQLRCPCGFFVLLALLLNVDLAH